MAGEPNESAATTNGAGGAPEPVAASPAAAPAAAVPAVEAAPAPAAPEAAPAPAVPAVPEREPSLLEVFDAEQAAKAKPVEPEKPAAEAKPDGEKPAEPAKPAAEAKPDEKPAEAKPAEAAPAEPEKAAAPEPVAYEYTLPETIKLDDTQRTELHTALDTFRADPAKGVQTLIDLHAKTMQDYANSLYGEQVKAFNETRKGWRTQVMADEELGGAGHDTSMGAVARMRDLLLANGRTPAEAERNRQEFDDFLKTTGAGDHPAFLRMLHAAARIFDEAPMPPPGPRPPPNLGAPKGRGLRAMYKTNQAQ